MAVITSKKVRFYRLMLSNPDTDDLSPLGQDAVDELLDKIQPLDEEGRTFTWRNRTLQGVVLTHASAHRGKYIYLGRMRRRNDLPDELGTGTPQSLAYNPTVKKVSEPCYVMPTGIDAAIAVLTTQQGAKDTDIGFWLSESYELKDGKTFELIPITNDRQLELLEEAQFVTKLEAQRAPGNATQSGPDGSSNIEKAFSTLGAMGGNQSTVFIKTSLGHSNPNTLAGEKFTTEAKDFLRSGSYDKAVATLKRLDPDGSDKLLTDQINFVRELITHTVHFKTDEDQPTEADHVLPAMAKAARENAQYLTIAGRSPDESPQR